jgi:hypothetical protein
VSLDDPTAQKGIEVYPQTIEALRRHTDLEDRERRKQFEADTHRRLLALELAMLENTKATREGNEVLQTFLALKGGIKVLGWLGKAAAWLAGLGAGGGVIYLVVYVVTHGKLPPSP